VLCRVCVYGGLCCTKPFKIKRTKQYYEDQKVICESLVSTEETLKDIKSYIKSKEKSDPMLNPDVNTTYVAPKGGGCSVM